jgi:hypothetical protein
MHDTRCGYWKRHQVSPWLARAVKMHVEPRLIETMLRTCRAGKWQVLEVARRL